MADLARQPTGRFHLRQRRRDSIGGTAAPTRSSAGSATTPLSPTPRCWHGAIRAIDLINTFGASTVWGGQGNDTIICNEGAVYGNEGDDRLVASTAAAIVSGGSGADTFVLATSDVGRIADLDRRRPDRCQHSRLLMPLRTAVLGTVSGELRRRAVSPWSATRAH